jgi:hypothetical protein
MSLHNPRARIEIDGTMFDSFYHPSLFTGMKVELTTNQSSMAEFSVVDEAFEFLDSYSRADGVLWAKAYVWLGFGKDLGESLFTGLLASVDYGRNISTFRFYDMGYRMKLQQKTEYHKGLDIEVIKKLAKRNDLEFEGPEDKYNFKGLPLKSKKQEAQTDWDFAMSLAEEAGLVLYVRGETLYAKPAARTSGPVLALECRDVMLLNPIDLHYKLPENQEGRPRRVEVRGRGRGGKRLVGESDESMRGTKKIILNRSLKNASKSEAIRRAQAKKEMEREHAFSCRIQTIHPAGWRVDVRDTIELLNMGFLFSGKYLVDSVSIDFSAGHLTRSFDLYRDVGNF